MIKIALHTVTDLLRFPQPLSEDAVALGFIGKSIPSTFCGNKRHFKSLVGFIVCLHIVVSPCVFRNVPCAHKASERRELRNRLRLALNPGVLDGLPVSRGTKVWATGVLLNVEVV